MADKSINFSWTNNIENKTLAPGSVVLDKTRGNLHIKSDSKQYCFESSRSHYLADYSWEQIVELCKTGEAASMFKVGDIKPLNITYKYGYNNNYTRSENPCVVLVGINHDNLTKVDENYNSGKSTACLTFQLRYPWSNRWSLTGTQDYKGQAINYSLLESYKVLQDNTFQSAFETAVRNSIKQVNKKCVAESTPRTSATNQYTPDNVTPSLKIETIPCKLFEPSLSELYLTTNLAEGDPYEYYRTRLSVGRKLCDVCYYQRDNATDWNGVPVNCFYSRSLLTHINTRSLDFTFFASGYNNTYTYNSKRYYLPYITRIGSLSASEDIYTPYNSMLHVVSGEFCPFIFFCL